MSNEELAGRTEKIFDLAKLLAQHIEYLGDYQQAHVRAVVAERLELSVVPKRLAATA